MVSGGTCSPAQVQLLPRRLRSCQPLSMAHRRQRQQERRQFVLPRIRQLAKCFERLGHQFGPPHYHISPVLSFAGELAGRKLCEFRSRFPPMIGGLAVWNTSRFRSDLTLPPSLPFPFCSHGILSSRTDLQDRSECGFAPDIGHALWRENLSRGKRKLGSETFRLLLLAMQLASRHLGRQCRRDHSAQCNRDRSSPHATRARQTLT